MSVRTVVRRGVTWAVRDIGPGQEEWVRLSGSDHGEYRTGGFCGLVDRPSAARATRSARPRRSRPAPSTSPRIASVVLTAQARQRILEELLDWEDGKNEARETAGYLVGRRDGSTFVITAAYGPGPGAIRAYGAVTLDLDYRATVANDCRAGEQILGNWHSHTDRTGPSPRDMESWAWSARKAGTGVHLGLIAYRKGSDWRYPTFTAHLSRGDNLRAQQIDLEEERWRY
jgi:integrative and conjugative element protein (TIGR02256 family)